MLTDKTSNIKSNFVYHLRNTAMTQSIEDETKAREISFPERLAASERKSNSPRVTRGSYQFPTLWFSRPAKP